jgi:prolyl-tRNA editing enzyme YbaK/EbsC (Cys-tRNA(Pro) deacylase)
MLKWKALKSQQLPQSLGLSLAQALKSLAFIDDTKAYINDLAKQLTHRDIINHWKQVLTNIEKGEKK